MIYYIISREYREREERRTTLSTRVRTASATVTVCGDAADWRRAGPRPGDVRYGDSAPRGPPTGRPLIFACAFPTLWRRWRRTYCKNIIITAGQCENQGKKKTIIQDVPSVSRRLFCFFFCETIDGISFSAGAGGFIRQFEISLRINNIGGRGGARGDQLSRVGNSRESDIIPRTSVRAD